MQSYSLPEAMLLCTHVLADRLLVRDWPNGLPWQDAAPEWLGNERHLLPAVLRLDQLDDTQHEEIARCLAVETASAILIRSDLSADDWLATSRSRWQTIPPPCCVLPILAFSFICCGSCRFRILLPCVTVRAAGGFHIVTYGTNSSSEIDRRRYGAGSTRLNRLH